MKISDLQPDLPSFLLKMPSTLRRDMAGIIKVNNTISYSRNHLSNHDQEATIAEIDQYCEAHQTKESLGETPQRLIVPKESFTTKFLKGEFENVPLKFIEKFSLTTGAAVLGLVAAAVVKTLGVA